VQEWDILPSELNPEPPPLGTREMADQPMQGQRGRRDCPLGKPFRRYARALRLERGAMPVEVGDQDLALGADVGRVYPVTPVPALRIGLGGLHHAVQDVMAD